MPDYIEITAKFAGTCSECYGHTNEGDIILWAKGYGAKHKVCPETVKKNYDLEIEEDFTQWKNPLRYPYVEVHDIKNCQRCGVDLTGGADKFLRADEGGFRAVCEGCS